VLAVLPFPAHFNRATGRFLVEDHVIAVTPSAAALGVLPHERSAISRPIIVFAPMPDTLPGTAAEARAIAAGVAGSRLRMGSEATEAAVRQALAAGLSVHIASHGDYDAHNPLFSRMIVGGGSSRDPANDGRLELHEILELQTSSPLVFLSGCETGLGGADNPLTQRFEDGSLAQAFLAAGARNVVATLWRVDDRDAVELARAFYRQLGTGDPPEDALAAAQRAAIRRGSGFTWAAYEAFGTSRAKLRRVAVQRGVNP
jgi:CHAT domain-containing protein